MIYTDTHISTERLENFALIIILRKDITNYSEYTVSSQDVLLVPFVLFVRNLIIFSVLFNDDYQCPISFIWIK